MPPKSPPKLEAKPESFKLPIIFGLPDVPICLLKVNIEAAIQQEKVLASLDKQRRELSMQIDKQKREMMQSLVEYKKYKQTQLDLFNLCLEKIIQRTFPFEEHVNVTDLDDIGIKEVGDKLSAANYTVSYITSNADVKRLSGIRIELSDG